MIQFCRDCKFFRKGKVTVNHSHCENPEVPKQLRKLDKEGRLPLCELVTRKMAKTKPPRSTSAPPALTIRHIPFIQYVNWIREDKYYSYLRYGDGEWKVIFRESGRNGRAHMITPEFHRDMRSCLFRNSGNPRVLFGMQRNTYRPEGRQVEIDTFLKKNNLMGIRWVSAETLHHASRDGVLLPLIKELKERHVIIVGPSFLDRLPDEIGLMHRSFIEIPERDCYEEQDQILRECMNIHDDLGNGLVYSFSAGPAAETLIPHLEEEIPNNFFIDFGSLWDIFVGKRTRRYTKDTKSYTRKTIMSNLGLRNQGPIR